MRCCAYREPCDFHFEHCPATEEYCTALGLKESDAVLCVSRTLQAEGRPVAYLIDVLPGDQLASAEIENGFTGSVLDLLLRRGSPGLTSSRCEINAVQASPEISKAMKIQRGDVLLRFIAYLYSTNGQVVDYSYSYFLPGYFNLHILRRVG
jgi:GntR family transcriptional regulator